MENVGEASLALVFFYHLFLKRNQFETCTYVRFVLPVVLMVANVAACCLLYFSFVYEAGSEFCCFILNSELRCSRSLLSAKITFALGVTYI